MHRMQYTIFDASCLPSIFVHLCVIIDLIHRTVLTRLMQKIRFPYGNKKKSVIYSKAKDFLNCKAQSLSRSSISSMKLSIVASSPIWALHILYHSRAWSKVNKVINFSLEMFCSTLASVPMFLFLSSPSQVLNLSPNSSLTS